MDRCLKGDTGDCGSAQIGQLLLHTAVRGRYDSRHTSMQAGSGATAGMRAPPCVYVQRPKLIVPGHPESSWPPGKHLHMDSQPLDSWIASTARVAPAPGLPDSLDQTDSASKAVPLHLHCFIEAQIQVRHCAQNLKFPTYSLASASS
eukprot:321005-Pelagomonas_calceolata.AAC.2